MIKLFLLQRVICLCPTTTILVSYLNMSWHKFIVSSKIIKSLKINQWKFFNLKENKKPFKQQTILSIFIIKHSQIVMVAPKEWHWKLKQLSKLQLSMKSAVNKYKRTEQNDINMIIIITLILLFIMSKDSPEKRRGRPQKKDSTIFIQAQELFSIHDTVFHAALLFYTFHIFDKTPSRRKFNPTIGYSIYEKLKSLSSVQKQYLIEDVWAIDQAQEWKQNKPLVNFFINSMTFGPKCVVEQFYTLFKFILSLQKEPTVQNCLQFIKESGFKYMNFNCSVLELLQVRSSDHKKSIKEVIDQQIHKFILIIIHSLWALKVGKKQNNYANILESQEDLFERGTHNKGRKLIKL